MGEAAPERVPRLRDAQVRGAGEIFWYQVIGAEPEDTLRRAADAA